MKTAAGGRRFFLGDAFVAYASRPSFIRHIVANASYAQWDAYSDQPVARSRDQQRAPVSDEPALMFEWVFLA